jgi:predicted unusual protein kinase regulating ubiquinone biosynthesis (AarF/ABC1/UbiB family)
MRLDILPWEYGHELSQMLDRMPPFPAAQAVAMVERSTGRPLGETFARFDPDPVRSTTVACTYQATLRSGGRIIVKVRRPGIGELFMADVKAIDWLAALLEMLTIIRPGFTHSMRRELHESLTEELSFVQQARRQDLFRRAAKRSGKRFFTAPRVRFDLSGADVIVEEYVSGIWLRELIAAVVQNDADMLALAGRLNIDVRKTARRLTWINYWTWHESLFFRADANPDRIIIGQDGRLTFIDFGSTGSIDRTKRRALEQNMYYAWKQDSLNMARASLALLEPLPAVDPIELTRELEAYNWQMLFAFASRRPDRGGLRRTSAWQWIGLVRLARRYNILIDIDVLRLVRANVMFDTLAVRLHPEINVIDEYRRFTKYRAARARRRARRRLIKQASDPDNNRRYLRMERLADAGQRLFFRLHHAVTVPRANFSALMSKGSFIAYKWIQFSVQVLALTVTSVVAVVAAQSWAGGRAINVRQALDVVLASAAFRVCVALLVFLNSRKVLMRMDDKDT